MPDAPETTAVTIPARYGHYLKCTSPLVLPRQVCAKCGSRQADGVLRHDNTSYYSPWIWLTVFISPFLMAIFYLLTRKNLNVDYYLCPKCADARKIRVVTTTVVSLVATAIVVGGFAVGEVFWVGYGFLVLIGSLFALASSQSAPIKALGHDGTHFTVKGLPEKVIDDLEEPIQ